MYSKILNVFLDKNSKKQKTVDSENSFPLYKVSDALFFFIADTCITDNQVKV